MAESLSLEEIADDSIFSKEQNVKRELSYFDENESADDCGYEKSEESKASVLLLKKAYLDKDLKFSDEILDDMVSKSFVKGLMKVHTASGYGLYELLEKYLKEEKMNPNAECSFNELASITPLHFCAGIGPDPITDDREKCIELLVNYGASINLLTSRGDTALHWATKLADSKTCESLIKHGVEINKINIDNCTCAHGAAFYKNIEVLELLVNSKVDVNVKDITGKNILHLLCKDSYEEISFSSNENEKKEKNLELIKFVARLLDEFKMDPNDKDINDFTPLMYACENENLELIQILIDHKAEVNFINKDGLNCMLIAIINSCSKVVKLLLKNGFDLKNKHKNCSYVTDAAYISDLEILTTLLDAGCDVNETKEDENRIILNPLWAACERSSFPIVELLLQKGANTIIREDLNMTALHGTAMAQYENVQIAKLLVEHKCPINLKSTQAGETPLFLACNSGYSEIVEYLISLGVDPNDSSPATRTCFQQAIFRGHKDIILLLLNKGYVLNEDDINDLYIYTIDLYQENDVEMINFFLGKNLITKEKTLETLKNFFNCYIIQPNQEELACSDKELEDPSNVATLSDLKLDFGIKYPTTIEELNVFLNSKCNLNLDCNSSEDELKLLK